MRDEVSASAVTVVRVAVPQGRATHQAAIGAVEESKGETLLSLDGRSNAL